GVLALGRIGMQQIAGRVHGRERHPMLLQLAGKAVALLLLADGSEVQMRARPRSPGADADLHILDPALGAPREHLGPGKLGQGIREDTDSHAIAFLNAEMSRATSRRACSTGVWTVAP